MKPIGVAVVGAGYWGPNLVRNVDQTRELRLAWVCDLDESRARAVVGRRETVHTTSRLDDVLADPRVSVVAVATPASTHYDVAMAAIEADKHVLVEKPLASSYPEAERLVVAAARRGTVLMCDYTYCYTPAVQKISELVRTGVLGDIQFVDSVRINLGLVQRDIDVLWDLAPHDLSILDYILPHGCRPRAVAAHGADPIGAGHACIAYLMLELERGAIAHAHVNWLSPIKIRKMIIGGSKRTLVWDDLDPVQRVSVFDRGVDLDDPDELGDDRRRDALVSYRTGDMVAPALPEREALRGVMDELVAAIREGRPPATDGAAGLRVLDILEAASRSLEYKGAVVPLRSSQ